MTLVIAGHYLLQGIHENESNDVNGLFAVSDSNITIPGLCGSRKVLVNNFEKVSEISIKVKSPNFLGGQFNNYLDCRSQRSCFIAFAGSSTLVAERLINEIRQHLANLYTTYEDDEYKIAMSCEKNRHIKQGYLYDTSMFQYHHLDLNKLLSAEYLLDVVNHSINAGLDKAKKNDVMNKAFEDFHVELILGVRCPRNQDFRLYEYEIKRNNEDVGIVTQVEIPVKKVAVIGRKKKYAEKALSHFTNAIENGKDTAKEMHDFLAKAIKEENEILDYSIGKPCVLYTFNGNNLEKKNTMRLNVDPQKLEHLMQVLGEKAQGSGCIYFTGGASALLMGWRNSTVNVDLHLDPEPPGISQAIPKLKEELSIDIELASPQDFLPPLPGWRDRSVLIDKRDQISFYHYDFIAQALSKISRGLDRDIKDIEAMYKQKLFSLDDLRDCFEAIAPELIRFPSLNPNVLRRRVESFIEYLRELC
jgi:hypothetical protein